MQTNDGEALRLILGAILVALPACIAAVFAASLYGMMRPQRPRSKALPVGEWRLNSAGTVVGMEKAR